MPNNPQHVAIIMDGNGRWAQKRGLPRLAGHEAGLNRITSVVKTALTAKIKYLTAFGFSTENWKRPEEEVSGLFNMLVENIDRKAEEMNSQNIKINHLGRLDGLPEGVRTSIMNACKLTQNNSRMVFNFAFNYGGRLELVDAARELIEAQIPPFNINEQLFSEFLYQPEIPDVDLLIRTGGEKRISNFLLWQAAYAELYFTSTLWPDFTPAKFNKALKEFSLRQRRFGGLKT